MGNCFSSSSSSPPGDAHTQPSCENHPAAVGKVSETLPCKKSNSFASETSSVPSLQAAPKDIEELRQTSGYQNVYVFTYDELRQATSNFPPDQILGEGGFGIVYKGVIDEDIRNGFKSTLVAVKELDPEGLQGDREWLAEINYLGQLSHPNLVKLVGYCCEDDHRLLVYEYMACGSLEQHLFHRRKSTDVSVSMPWPLRMKIALGAAKGLAFLHGAERSIIYRDFKTSNILLDAEYNAKLSDFGLAKDGPMGEQTHVSTRVMGTYGYAAPEYIMTGHLTAMSDVYGFGVVLLEMLIGRKAMDKDRPGQEHNLVEWARPLLIRASKLMKIIDPRMDGQYSNKEVQKVAHLAYQCLSESPKGRPTMGVVVGTLAAFDKLPESALALYRGARESAEARRDAVMHGRKRSDLPPSGRNRSEPPREYLRARHGSPKKPDGPQPRMKPSSARDGRERI